jgi:AcrR family transcriptional regulator
MMESDRRVQRTRALLQSALLELLGKRRYHAITIQDIVDRANVGRTTFYLHYTSKDALFLSCHEAKASAFHFGSLTRAELLSPEAPSEMISAYRHLDEARTQLYPIFRGKENLALLRQMRKLRAQEIEVNLRAAFSGIESAIPLEVLAENLAGAHLALVQWWLEKRQPYTPKEIAQAYHRLQRAAIRDAFGLEDGE